MDKHYEYKRIFMFWADALYVLIQAAVFGWMWYNFFSKMMLFEYWRRGNYVIIGFYALFCLLFTSVFGGLKVGYRRNIDVLYAQLFAALCTNGAVYLELSLIGNWKFGTNLWYMFQLFLFDVVLSFFWTLIVRWFYARLYPPHQMLFIHGDVDPSHLVEKINSRRDRYRIKEMVHLSKGIENIAKMVDSYDTVLIGDIPSKERNYFLKYCYWHNIRCYSVPKISDIMIQSGFRIDLFDTILMLQRNNGLTLFQRFMKRLMDIVISLIGLILASPFMLIIYIAIKIDDGGPVIYTQERLTKGGVPFKIYKFRSMITDSEKYGARLAAENDDRITRVGRVIRRLHFDELPQLYNILIGDMSFVGPRPERQDIFDKYEESIPEFKFRLKMKAGLTGYAQVYGQYNTKPYDKLKLDLTYIEQYTLWLDIKLIFLTVKILFQKEKSEGVDDSKTNAL
ncbi:MAG: exopolysaccharide biosynthesis polyprenyl glycosylphosphotransferase [Lachnospiraceae bacterium]|nr:exopolysaccharide biosynthesis polyprenyl glycosylphosphotransferase [Lachnospiraceae bacterium]